MIMKFRELHAIMDTSRKQGALGELRLFLKWWKEDLPDIPEDYIKRRIKELKRVKK